jgi:anti-anti-sigma factor
VVAGNDVSFSASPRGGGEVAIQGDVDLASAPAFEASLRAVIDHSDGDVTIDLAGVGFMDSSGMNVLVRVFKALERKGRGLHLTNLSSSVRRALEVGGASQFVTMD